MARLPRNAAEAAGELGIPPGSTVLAFSPANGWPEALAGAVGEEGRVIVHDPPPDAELPPNAQAVEEVADDLTGAAVLVWLGPVPAHDVRRFPSRVADGGALWAVIPAAAGGRMAPVHEADVRKSLMVAGWRDDRVVRLSVDAYAMRFRKRR